MLPLLRMGRGKMMGVDHNKGLSWVGASAGFMARLSYQGAISIAMRSGQTARQLTLIASLNPADPQRSTRSAIELSSASSCVT